MSDAAWTLAIAAVAVAAAAGLALRAARAVVGVHAPAASGTPHEIELVLDDTADRRRHDAAIGAALLQAWADGHTAGPAPATATLARAAPGSIAYRIAYAADPHRAPEADVRHAVLEQLHRHLRHAGVALAGAADGSPPIDPSSVADRAACIARTHLFEDLPADERQALAAELLVRHEDAGQPVVNEGSPGSTMFIVAAGVLEVCTSATRLAPARRLATLGPGDFFGEMAPLSGAPRSATVSTLGPVLLFEIPPATLNALLRRRPVLAEGLSQVISMHLRRDAERLVDA